MQKMFFLLLACSLFMPIKAQDFFTIKVGTFRDVKADDFATLKGQGFIYGAPGSDNTTDVYLGLYSNQANATTTARNLTGNGFRNAQALVLPAAAAQQVTVIQIALHSGNRPIDWATLERAGQLYVESIDGTMKILTGIYPDARTAASVLPSIRELGYSDAFVRNISNNRLIPITTFETGIKKPLIPISMQSAKNPEETTLSPAPQPVSTGNPAPATYGAPAATTPQPYNPPAVNPPAPYTPPVNTPAPSATATTTSLPAPANAPNLPAIDGKTKRHSSAELQRVLKEKGFYTGSVDGFYGPGTSTAYEAAWDKMPEIRKYRKLSELVMEPAGSRDLVSQWPEIKTLQAVAADLAAGMANDTRARQLVQQRSELTGARQPLNAAAATRVNNWASTIWANLEDWAVEDPLHAQIFSAFRITFHQSQVRLEDHYMDQGLAPLDARDLASAMLQNLIGAQLDRFL